MEMKLKKIGAMVVVMVLTFSQVLAVVPTPVMAGEDDDETDYSDVYSALDYLDLDNATVTPAMATGGDTLQWEIPARESSVEKCDLINIVYYDVKKESRGLLFSDVFLRGQFICWRTQINRI